MEIISKSKTFVGDGLDIELKTGWKQSEIRNHLNIKLLKKAPDINSLGEFDPTETGEIERVIGNEYGPGKYELVLLANKKPVDRTEIDVLDFFLFPTTIPKNGTSFIQFVGPPDAVIPRIGIDVEDEFKSSYLTSYAVSPGGKGIQIVPVEWEGKSRNLSLNVREEGWSDGCLQAMRRVLNQETPGETTTPLIVVSPLHKLYFSPIRQWVDEILRENEEIEVGTLYYKIPETTGSKSHNIKDALNVIEVRKGLLPVLIDEKAGRKTVCDPRAYDCPKCSRRLQSVLKDNRIVFECENNECEINSVDRINFTLESILENPPGIVFMSGNFFNREVIEGRLRYNVFLPGGELIGCRNCNRIDRDRTWISSLGEEEVKSILKRIRKDEEENIRDHNRIMDKEFKYRDLRKQKKKTRSKRGELKREKKMLQKYIEGVRQQGNKVEVIFKSLSSPRVKGSKAKKEDIGKSPVEQKQGKRLINILGESTFSRLLGKVERVLTECKRDLEKNEEASVFKLRQIQEEINSNEIREEEIENQIKEIKKELENKNVETFSELREKFWGEVSDKMKDIFKQKYAGFRGKYKSFVERVRNPRDKLIDSHLRLNVNTECHTCGGDLESIQKTQTVLIHKPASENLPSYMTAGDIDIAFIEKILRQRKEDVELISCRY